MAFSDMKSLPHLIKPVTLILVVLQMICVFSPHYKPSFAWFPITTTILMLIICVLVFAVFAVNYMPVTDAPMWPLAEMIYSSVFAVCSAVNVFYFIVNIFKHTNFWHFLGTGTAVLLTLCWGFDAFMWFRNRSGSSSSSRSNNQATAAPPTFPSFPAGHNAGSNPA